MAEDRQSDWQVPRLERSADDRYAWIEEQIKEGEGFLESQSAYKNLAKNIRIFDGIFSDKTKSTLISNGLKYDIRKFVETISEVREIGTYGSDSPPFKPIAELLTKVAKALYMEAQFPSQIRKVLQLGTVMGRAYLWPKVRAKNYGFGERHIDFDPMSILDVVPVQIPSYTNDVQDAYAATGYEYMPIAEAHGKFPLFQSRLVPVSAVSFQSRVQARRVDYMDRRYADQTRNWGNLYCEIRYTFIRDIRINNTGYEMPMGDIGTSWFYKVPSVGQDIFGGIRNGQKVMRKAMIEDCLVYPYLRLIITSPGMDTPMYDGPAFDWHGEIPFVQYDVDDWAWEALGRSLVEDVGSIEMTKRKHERKMDVVLATKMNPPLGYDRSVTGSPPKIENFNIFEEDVHIGVDGEPQKMLQSVLPDSVNVEESNFKFLEFLAAARKEQLGINDLGNLAALKLNLAGESLDKALEPIGPIAKGIAVRMEAANAKVARLGKFMIPQWLDVGRIIEYVGPDNVPAEVFDLMPRSLVPSHMPDEYVNGMPPTTGEGENIQQVASQYDEIERSRRMTKNIKLVSVPSTLIKITQRDEQLKLMTLKKQGAPIGWCDIMPKLGIENFGEVKGNTVRERWMNEQIEEIKFKAEAMKFMQAEGVAEPPGAGQGKGGGRPNSNKKPAKPAQKGGAGGEPRTTVKTS